MTDTKTVHVNPTHRPGAAGAAQRLVEAGFDPAKIADWMRQEDMRATPIRDSATALADVMAALCMAFGAGTTDLHGALLSKQHGVVKLFEKCLQARIDKGRMSPGGVFIPTTFN